MRQQIQTILLEMRNEFLQPHTKPWIVGFSGGKDSAILAHLTAEMLLSIAPDLRQRRKVYIVCNDTQVESPVFESFVEKTLSRMKEGFDALRLPIEVIRTRPEIKDTFWFNLIGKGYPAPNPKFRWCVDRLKIRPTTKFLRDTVHEGGEAILLLGVRKSESIARARRIEKYSKESDYARLVPHHDIQGCSIFRPIMDLTTEQVWEYLRRNRPPWGGDHLDLESLYHDANAGDLDFIVDGKSAPSAKSPILARFGCWTCTVIEKDKSIEGLIESGYTSLKPLVGFRDRLKEISATPSHRSKTRRNGSYGLGPLTIETRRMLLEELLAIQDQTGMSLISNEEVRLIREQWASDEITATMRLVLSQTKHKGCKNNWTCVECTCRH